jgi:uncharacterized protein (TIRG00374 family)
MSAKQLILTLLFILVPLALLAWFVDWEMVLRLLRRINTWQLVLASVFLVVGYLAFAQRWRLLLSGRPQFMPTFHASNAGNLANTLLPVRPGDAARIVMLGGSDDLSYALVTSSIIVERWFEQVMRLAALGGAMIFGMGMAVSVWTIAGILVFLVGVYGIMLWMLWRREFVLDRLPKWLARIPRVKEDSTRQVLANLIDGLAGVSSTRYLIVLLVWSCITWGLYWAFHYTVLMALGVNLAPATTLAISLGALALVPPSATTLPGVFQASMVVPLVLVGFDENLLTSYALVLNTLEMVWIMFLGVWGITYGGYSFRWLMGKHPMPEES